MPTDASQKPRRGRPERDSEQLRARADRAVITAIDDWAATRAVTRAEAVRRLVIAGLEATRKEDLSA